jgi:hypothetical protein
MSFAAVPNSFALARKNLPLSPDIGMHLPPLDPLPETSITPSLVRLPVRPVCPVNSRLWRTARQPDPACSFGFWIGLRFPDGPGRLRLSACVSQAGFITAAETGVRSLFGRAFLPGIAPKR